MGVDLLDLFDRASTWAASKIPAAMGNLNASTPCRDWDVRAPLNHLLHSQRLVAGAAHGGSATPPPGRPPDLLGENPFLQYEEGRRATVAAYREPGVVEKAGATLAIASVEQLVHGWDLATATGQEATMPDDLAKAAFAVVDGRMSDRQRGTFFEPAVPVPDDARAQDKLLGYLGRDPRGGSDKATSATSPQ